MSTLSVTAILPCYNSARFLEQTLDSILGQSYPDVSVIAVDDGSTDDTPQVLGKYLASGRLKMFSHEGNRNRGVAASMNLGLEMASSDLIAFIDHDDVWYPDKIRRQVEVFEQTPEVDMVYTNGDVINQYGKKMYSILGPSHRESNRPENLLLDCYIKSCSMVMVARKAMEKAGRFKEHLLPTDHDMWLRLQEVATLHYLSDCLIGYRVHATQSSHKRKLWEDGFIILADALKRFPYSRAAAKKRLAVLHYRLAEHDLRSGKRIRSARNFLLSLYLDPARSLKHLYSKLTAA